jgi:hypothetical protein
MEGGNQAVQMQQAASQFLNNSIRRIYHECMCGKFAPCINVMENALDLINDDVSSSSLGDHSDMVKIPDTIIKVNSTLVYRF